MLTSKASLTRALILFPEDTLEPAYLHLADSLSLSATEAETGSPPRHYHESMDAYSRKVIEEALRRKGWNQTRASEELGLQRTYLTKLLRQKDIHGTTQRFLLIFRGRFTLNLDRIIHEASAASADACLKRDGRDWREKRDR
jgi:hypothetical protein